MTDDASPADLFDRHRRSIRRARRFTDGEDYFGGLMADALIERLGDVTREFADVLVIGGRNPRLAEQLRAKGLAVTVAEQSAAIARRISALNGEEARLPVEPESYDLILWPGGIESVNDVPGALLRCRLALRPDGLLLGCFVGEGSFPRLRAALAQAEAGRPVARMHPQLDFRGFGELLRQIGLALPVIDIDRVAIVYRKLASLVADLRNAALTNVLAGPIEPLSRANWARACAVFEAGAGADEPEHIAIVHFSGWAPHPDQPQPARRGSATASLAAALKPGGS